MSSASRYAAGLSPRVRGIHHRRARPVRDRGSIPACTGNPGRCSWRSRTGAVYPRVYGESTCSSVTSPSLCGLSPRVRGIHDHLGHRAVLDGSIPACTGNPERDVNPPAGDRVYPRVYGESGADCACQPAVRGLSPRVRGILVDRPALPRADGSIPACTGNPAHARRSAAAPEVYPRVYGESCLR